MLLSDFLNEFRFGHQLCHIAVFLLNSWQHAINYATWDQSRRLRVQLIAFGESLPLADILAQRLHARRDQRVTLDDGQNRAIALPAAS
jgi:hypothetical protein